MYDEIPKTPEEALEGSIKKWQKVVENGGFHGTGKCPLCQYYKEQNGNCSGCPVCEAGHDNCVGSTYADYVSVFTVEECLEAAKRELQFLISLRPKPKSLMTWDEEGVDVKFVHGRSEDGHICWIQLKSETGFPLLNLLDDYYTLPVETRLKYLEEIEEYIRKNCYDRHYYSLKWVPIHKEE